MKLFSCGSCGNTVYFENVSCEQCGHALGYAPDLIEMLALDPDGGVLVNVADRTGRFAYCANHQHGACNWLVPAGVQAEQYCVACRHNDTVPPLADPVNVFHWQAMERAKKRLFYSLLRLQLPLATRDEDPEHGLSFRFLADDGAGSAPVMTGHDNGIITIALIEADDAQREARRTSMGEPYRTLLGHFRHEVGHHYWDLLVRSEPNLSTFRNLFGDESVDYGDALQRHYAQGAPADWPQRFISAYATAHPWEDFAESWAHYLLIVDTVETALAFNVGAAPAADKDASLAVKVDIDPYTNVLFAPIVDNWVPLTLLLNNLNRAVGQPDAYPFVLSPAVVEKLSFIHSLVRNHLMRRDAQ
ncbi:MAG: hypothetical protein JWQ22_597 [Devosia sp.]|nr:hypothetical protein [Devosia sp.]